MKSVQIFSKDYLEYCKKMTSAQIISFLEDFRNLHLSKGKPKSRLISIKIPEIMLKSFKSKAQLSGMHYQTQIKILMEEWLKS
ncbi:MAG: BrnA antitoxin family protein [Elusimicrobia bacterium]|nr:BrnA antitoxin family protein [Elusimicrobiota bacterium]